MIPIVGVALIIGFSSKDELVGKVLGSKPFVWIGLISYSAYLWHYPIFAFSRIERSSLTNFDKLELIMVTVVLSIFGYFFIEKTFRNKVASRSFFLVLALVSTLLIVWLSFVGFSKGFEKIWANYSSENKVRLVVLS